MVLFGRRFNIEHLAIRLTVIQKAETLKGLRLIGVTFGQVFIGVAWRVR